MDRESRSKDSFVFTQQQLDTFWSQYVGMTADEVLTATIPGDGYRGPEWSAMLSYVQRNRLYGFANYLPDPGHVAGENQGTRNNGGVFNGPIRSE
jgi:hypothetical protein